MKALGKLPRKKKASRPRPIDTSEVEDVDSHNTAKVSNIEFFEDEMMSTFSRPNLMSH